MESADIIRKDEAVSVFCLWLCAISVFRPTSNGVSALIQLFGDEGFGFDAFGPLCRIRVSMCCSLKKD